MRLIPFVFLLPALAFAADDSPSGTRITPPTLREISPLGVPRGGTVEVSIVGYNLAHASAIYFSERGIEARITRIKELPDQDDVRLGGNGTPLTVDLGPLPVRNEITAELDIPATAPIGPVKFRVLTPLGLSPQGTLSVEPFYGETPDREPNDTVEDATEQTFLPTILVGAISKPGDVDYYKIHARAGEQVVFEDNGRMLGSALQPIITIYDADQNVIETFHEDAARMVDSFGHKFEKEGTYYVRISDYNESGSGRHFYRIMMGSLPVVVSAFPLGVEQGKTAEVALTGFNLAAAKVAVKGEPNEGEYDSLWLRPEGTQGPSFSKIRLAVGTEPEILAKETTSAQAITLPVTINGRLTTAHHDFKFHARKGEKLILEVNAARLGSPLDSQLEVLDAQGRPIERAEARAVLQTSIALAERGSTGSGIRLDSPAGLQVGDYLMTGAEIVQIDAMPRGPDDDTVMVNFEGQRLGYLDTTPEAHAADTPVYKVEIHPPGTKFAPNGLPLAHLMYSNDDGGPGYGKDSRLHFTAPADADYLVRISDVRELNGPEYTYRLSIHEPHPDFRLSVTPRNPNVPAGGRIPLTVTALRLDDFDGPIPVSIKDLPAGLHATSGVIAPGQKSTTLTLSADADAKLANAVPLKVVDEKGREADSMDRLKLVAVMPRADVDVTAETHEVVLEPGGRAKIEVSVSRNNGFAGRVPLDVRNLPPTVRVIDVGLNGVLVNETETKRTFTLEALPWAEPMVQPVFVSGDVETRAGGQQNAILSAPITLRITKGRQELSQK
jgi:hypothetical protein